ncbi:MAG: o-succinylbenzoate--CoA ligase [Anaerolineae bacterium]|nr:o-succinylbenzoate--CoA ligase [Anaerolineae bacterium]
MENWLVARARATPERLALRHEGAAWNYAALARLVERLAGGLAAAGVAPGAHVGTLLPNGVLFAAVVHALARLGAVLVPLNTRLTPGELAWQVEAASVRLLLYGEEIEAAAAEVASITGVARRAAAGLPACAPVPPPIPLALDDVQAIVFTSGTSGRPKGAMLTYGNHFWSATASAYHLGVLPDDRWLSVLPLYHVGGLAVLFRSCLYGTAAVLQKGFDLGAVSRSLDEEQITIVSLVPTMLYRLLPVRVSWPARLRLVLLGGAAPGQALLEQATAAGVPVATTYGLTEASSQVATMLPDGVRRKPGSVGRPLLFSEVRIVDEGGEPLAPGQYGEVVVRGPAVMAGYYGEPEATAHTLREGWLHTGDIGYLDDDGDLWLVQRRSDVIVSGGENVYPAEVEAVLHQHPAVAAAAVVGLPDAEWGERVGALVVPAAGVRLEAEPLLRFLRERLAGYKLPRTIRFVAALPQTASGKIARAAVREMLLAGGDELA